MSTCKFKKNDYIMNTYTKEIFFVVVVKEHEIILRNEENDNLSQHKIHAINRNCISVDKDTAKILYKKEKNSVD